MRRWLFCVAMGGAACAWGGEDYLEATGYRALAAELGDGLPTGARVKVSQVEFGDGEYLPQVGAGTFAGSGAVFGGKTFSAKGGASGASGHAWAVGAHFYGANGDPELGRASLAPGVAAIEVYRVDSAGSAASWTGQAWLEPGSLRAPLVESGAVQNHSWISVGGSERAAADNAALRRFDFAIRRDGFLAVTGVNNGVSAVPSLMASAYNNIAVGLSSGGHSRGGVSAWLDGPGRQKPELVAPLDYTSFAAALVSSAAALLRQAADAQGGDAVKPETLKAILLAGATKEEFPGWSRRAGAPLDPVYGAGELEVGHAWHILAGRGQAANQASPRPDWAWARVALSAGGTADYVLRIPPGRVGAACSAVAAWNRVVSDVAPGSSFVMAVADLADYQLSLARLSGAGAAVVIDESLSAVDNVEHIYQRQLPSGTYRLRVSLARGGSVPVALAWRLSTVEHRPEVVLARAGGRDGLTCRGLVTGQAYVVQSSEDLIGWRAEEAFVAGGAEHRWSGSGGEGRRYYRLGATD